MGLQETEEDTGRVLERMENSLCSMEQLALDSINITDRLLMLINSAREKAVNMKVASPDDSQKEYLSICVILEQLLEMAYEVSNVAHELEKESVYQQDTTQRIAQIIDFLYAMIDSHDLD